MDVPGNFTPEELEVRSGSTEKILKEVRTAHSRSPVDLFLSYFYNSHFDPAGFDELRRLSIPSVNFYCNSIHQFELVADVAAKVDFAWHTEKNAREDYLGVGAKPIWVQMGADPALYHPIPGSNRSPRACFVGQRYADRDRWIASLIGAGVPVEIYGAGWDFGTAAARSSDAASDESLTASLGRRREVPGSLRSYVAAVRENMGRKGLAAGVLRSLRQWNYKRETRSLTPLIAASARSPFQGEIAAVFSQYEVCLNFSNVWSDGRPGSPLIPHVRLRDFEAPMCRSCYITGHTEEIAEFYEVGREIETYRSPAELADKVRFFLDHPASGEKMREAGYQRAFRDHTWKCRFGELFRKIGLSHA
jgi:spore maturation protein CgeB